MLRAQIVVLGCLPVMAFAQAGASSTGSKAPAPSGFKQPTLAQRKSSLPSPPPGVARLSDPGVTGGKLTKRVDPELPEGAPVGFRDEVMLSVIIDVEGKPADITVVDPGQHGAVDQATKAVRGWRWEPAKKDGAPTPLQVGVIVSFRKM